VKRLCDAGFLSPDEFVQYSEAITGPASNLTSLLTELLGKLIDTNTVAFLVNDPDAWVS